MRVAVPELSHHDARGMVGNLGRFLQGASGTESQREQSDGGIPRAGHVEDFLGARGCVVRRTLPVEEDHSVLAQGHEH